MGSTLERAKLTAKGICTSRSLALRRLRAHRRRNAGHLFFGQGQYPVFFVAQDILTELGAQHRQALGNLSQAVAARLFEFGTGAHKIQMIAFQDFLDSASSPKPSRCR
jgi:hypothetical protein